MYLVCTKTPRGGLELFVCVVGGVLKAGGTCLRVKCDQELVVKRNVTLHGKT